MINKSKTRTASMILAIIGIIDSLYLSYAKISHSELYCAGSNNCATVNSSSYSEVFGIPNAFLGAGGYIVIFLLFYLEERNKFVKEYSSIIVLGLTIIGALYSVFLTYVEVALLKAVCPYCFISAVVMWILFILASIKVFKSSS